MFNFVSWMGCGSSQTRELIKKEIDTDFMKDSHALEVSKGKLEIPLLTPPKKDIAPEPKAVAFLTHITGLVFSTNNTDGAKKKYTELLFSGPDPSDQPGVLFICSNVEVMDYFNIFTKDTATNSSIRDDFIVLQKIPVKRAKYTASLVYTFFNYCQRTRRYSEDGTIKEDKNWYQPPNTMVENRFKLLVQKICEAVNEHHTLINEAWPEQIKYQQLTSPKKDMRLEFVNSDEENKKK
jgi:hypothetical protein